MKGDFKKAEDLILAVIEKENNLYTEFKIEYETKDEYITMHARYYFGEAVLKFADIVRTFNLNLLINESYKEGRTEIMISEKE